MCRGAGREYRAIKKDFTVDQSSGLHNSCLITMTWPELEQHMRLGGNWCRTDWKRNLCIAYPYQFFFGSRMCCFLHICICAQQRENESTVDTYTKTCILYIPFHHHHPPNSQFFVVFLFILNWLLTIEWKDNIYCSMRQPVFSQFHSFHMQATMKTHWWSIFNVSIVWRQERAATLSAAQYEQQGSLIYRDKLSLDFYRSIYTFEED